MHTTFHLNSAQDVSSALPDAIKAAYNSKPITIIVEVEEDLSQEMKRALQNFVTQMNHYKRVIPKNRDRLSNTFKN